MIDNIENKQESTAPKWLKEIQKEIIKEKLCNNKITKQINDIVDKDCNFDKIDDCIEHLRIKTSKQKYLEESLQIAYEYNLYAKDYEQYFKLLQETPSERWEKTTMDFVIRKTFEDCKIKDLDTILNEIYTKSPELKTIITKKELNQKYKNINNYKSEYCHKLIYDPSIVSLIIKTPFNENDEKQAIEPLFKYFDEKYLNHPKNLNIDFKKNDIYKKKFEKLKYTKIEDYNKQDIHNWAFITKRLNKANKPSDNEILAVIFKAIELANKEKGLKWHKPRIPQILSALILISKGDNIAEIAQVNTGEGKTLIAVIVAAHRVLKYGKCDIITSSRELLEPNINKIKHIYDMLNITYADNNIKVKNKNSYNNIAKSIYAKDIVYGTPSDFSFHLIDDMIDRKNIRVGRGFPYCIIDEIDNLLYDNFQMSTLCTSHLPGMHHCLLPLLSAQHEIQNLKNHVLLYNGQYHLCTKDFYYEDKKLVINLNPFENIEDFLIPLKDPENEILQDVKFRLKHIFRTLDKEVLEDWKNYKTFKIEYKKQIKKIEDEEDEKIKEEEHENLINLENQAEKFEWLNKENKEKKLPYLDTPNYLRDYIQFMLPTWINNSMHFNQSYGDKENYLIDKKKNNVRFVDYDNTGEISDNMIYTGGVDQLIRVFNSIKLKQQNPTNRFISHTSFFKKYGKNLVGMTGTAGNKNLHKFYKNNFGIEVCIIPPYAKRVIHNNKKNKYICKELKPIIKKTKHEWMTEIVISIQQRAKNNIPCLIICKTIKIAEEIKEKLDPKKIYSKRITVYDGQNEAVKKEINNNKLKETDVIISTNIAGRGTDIETNKLIEEKSGLHVCLTFLPENERIELQNVGRTARQGNRGTAQLIIHDPEDRDIHTLKKLRRDKQIKQIKNVNEIIQNNINKDKLFARFCDFLNENFAKHSKYLDQNYKTAVIERWGTWYNMNESLIQNDYNKACKEYSKFEKQVLNHNGFDFVKNPYHHLIRGNRYLEEGNKTIAKSFSQAISNWWLQKNWESYFYTAKTCYNRAINLDPVYSIEARYYKAFAILKLDGSSFANMSTAMELLKETIDLTKKYQIDEWENIADCITNKKNHKAIHQIQNIINLHAHKINSARQALKEINAAYSNNNKIGVHAVTFKEYFNNDDEYEKYKDEVDFLENNGLFKLFGAKEIEKAKGLEYVLTIGINVFTFVFATGLLLCPVPIISSIGLGLMIESATNFFVTSYDYWFNDTLDFAAWAKSKVKGMAISAGVASLCYLSGYSNVASGVPKGSQGWTIFTNEILKKGCRNALAWGVLGAGSLILGKKINQLIDQTRTQEKEEIRKEVQNQIYQNLKSNVNIQKAIQIDNNLKTNEWQNKLYGNAVEVIKSLDYDDTINTTATGLKGLFSNILKNNIPANMIVDTTKATGNYIQSKHYTSKFINKFEYKIKNHENQINSEIKKSKQIKLKNQKTKAKKKDIKKEFLNGRIYKDIKPAYSENNIFCTKKSKANLKATTYIPSNIKSLSKNISDCVATVVNKHKTTSINTISSTVYNEVMANPFQKKFMKKDDQELANLQSTQRYFSGFKYDNKPNFNYEKYCQNRINAIKTGGKFTEGDMDVFACKYGVKITILDRNKEKITSLGSGKEIRLVLKGSHVESEKYGYIFSMQKNDCFPQAMSKELNIPVSKIYDITEKGYKENPDISIYNRGIIKAGAIPLPALELGAGIGLAFDHKLKNKKENGDLLESLSDNVKFMGNAIANSIIDPASKALELYAQSKYGNKITAVPDQKSHIEIFPRIYNDDNGIRTSPHIPNLLNPSLYPHLYKNPNDVLGINNKKGILVNRFPDILDNDGRFITDDVASLGLLDKSSILMANDKSDIDHSSDNNKTTSKQSKKIHNQNLKDVKRISDIYLKQKNKDAHQIKWDALNDNAKISEFDLYKHNKTGEIIIYRKGGKGLPIHTGEYI